jgi:CubicO group peptidase (beta-lactamase class C family)
MLAQGGRWNGTQIIAESIVRRLEQTHTQGNDAVLLAPIAFSAGMMQDPLNEDPESEGGKLRQLYGPSRRAFGHPGAGGSLAFADPENGIAFAYVMNQMEVGALPGERVQGLVRALYGG